MAAEIFAAAETGRVFLVADIVHGAEPLGCIHAAGIVDDERHARGDDFLEGVIHGLGHPVRADDGARLLAERGADQLGGIRAEIVVVLRTEPGHRAAGQFGDLAGVVGALLDLRPERVVGLAADDEDLRPIGHCGGGDLSPSRPPSSSPSRVSLHASCRLLPVAVVRRVLKNFEFAPARLSPVARRVDRCFARLTPRRSCAPSSSGSGRPSWHRPLWCRRARCRTIYRAGSARRRRSSPRNICGAGSARRRGY